jgi:uncharacterized RDD family membrane protein YckC
MPIDPITHPTFDPIVDPIAPQLSIDTPELVSIEMPLAGIGSRFIAIFIDYLIWTVGIVILGILAAIVLPGLAITDHISENWAVAILFIGVFLVHWGYFTLFEVLSNGKTPGKRLARIRVIHRSGRAISFVESLARNLVRVVDYLPSLYAIGLISIFVTRQSQRLGDLVAGTLVVRDREIETPHWGELGSRELGSSTITAPSLQPAVFGLSATQSSAQPPASSLDPLRTPPHLRVTLPASSVAKLSAADLSVLEGFFARRLDMDLETRAALAERIAVAIKAKSGLIQPEGVTVETFLEAVAHQLRELGITR